MITTRRTKETDEDLKDHIRMSYIEHEDWIYLYGYHIKIDIFGLHNVRITIDLEPKL